MASETSAIALRSEEIRKEMPIATASGGDVANLSHDLFFYFIVLYNNFFVCSEIGFIMGLSRKLNYFVRTIFFYFVDRFFFYYLVRTIFL